MGGRGRGHRRQQQLNVQSTGSQTAVDFPNVFQIPEDQRVRAERAELLTKLKRESYRARTFRKWIKWNYPSWLLLAKSGFFYYNEIDNVQCAFCFGIIGHWDASQDPDTQHKLRFPGCPFISLGGGTAMGNIPLTSEPVDVYSSIVFAECQLELLDPIEFKLDDAFNYPAGVLQDFPYYLEMSSVILKRPFRFEELKIIEFSISCNEYRDTSVRLDTFEKWSRQFVQKPDELADCGFFYTGKYDRVTCFACDGSFQDWRAEDTNPWIRHILKKPWCSFVRLRIEEKDIFDVLIQDSRRMNSLPASSSSSNQQQQTPSSPPPPPPQPPLPQDSLTEQQMNDMLKCKICITCPVELVMLPCAHLSTCVQCAGNLDRCPICREVFRGFVKLRDNPQQQPQQQLLNQPSSSSSSSQPQQINADVLKCKHCNNSQRDAVVLPCAHFATCIPCTNTLDRCVLCKEVFRGFLKVYLS